ncbi:MAG TPA: protoporphyrinogen oxidase [Blastocatellia bacterium]|nr:protoporphyrinogen oxidase [Blastocatellia bacterium]
MTGEVREAVVIGAGLSGLVCAHRLKSLGVDVMLLESSDRVGGVIQSERVDGFLIERGPNSSQGSEELLALVDELQITGELIEGDPKAPAYIYFNRKLHAVPAGPGPFIKSSLLSASGKLRIFGDLFVRARRSDEEESVASFARRRIGPQAAERMIAPFVSGVYAGDSERLSVQAAFPRLADLEKSYGGLFRGAIAKARAARREKKAASGVAGKASPTRKRLITFKKGMGFLPQTLASRLGEDLKTGCGNLTISQASGAKGISRFLVSYDRAGRTEQVASSRAIIAVPARAASRLLTPISDELGRLLEQIEYPPLSIVYLAYDESKIKTRLDGFGFLAAPSEGMNVLGCVWNTALFENRAPKGKALLTTFIGGARRPETARLTDAELARTAHSELQQVLGIESDPQVVAITRWDRAIPQYNLGHAHRVRRIETLAGQIGGLALIGNYLRGVSTGDCIKEADRAARELGLR